MLNIRVFYTKTDRAKYISHLDMSRFMARAIKRSGLPIWYTEGFNPHIYTTFALPLSLGFESDCESMDIRLTVDQTDLAAAAQTLDACMPQGLKVTKVALPVQKPDVIHWADFDVKLYCQDPTALQQAFITYTDTKEIFVIKKSKKREQILDLKPLFTLQGSSAEDGYVLLRLRMAAGGTLNINPNLLLDAFFAKHNFACTSTAIRRTAVLDEKFQDFA